MSILRMHRLSRRAGAALAFVLALSSPAAAQTQTQAPATLLVDRDMTPAAGAEDVLAVQRLLASVEDRLLPIRFPEATPSRHALGITYRLGKWAALDLPQDAFLMVAAHEVFGHGSRLREIDAAGVRYHFSAPPPYGSGSAATLFDEASLRMATRADRLAIDTAGIEAQNVLADDIGRQALARGSLTYREAWLYAQSRIAGLLYIERASSRSASGNDVVDFLMDLNGECAPQACTPLELSTLKHRALLLLADPMLAFSAYAFAAAYVVRGLSATSVPMIPIGRGLRYLPAAGFAMTPYGTEWTTEHGIRKGDRLITLSVRAGDTGATRPWGIGVRADRVAQRGRIAVDLAADVWSQPPIEAPAPAAALTAGGLVAATMHIALGHARTYGRVGLIGEVGYKSDGFVRGERSKAGPIVRAGVAIPIGSD